MKVTVITNSSYPIGPVTSHRVHYLSKGLVESGVDVNVLITQPTEKNGNIKNTLSEGVFDGVHFESVIRSNVRNNNLLIRKLVDYYCYVKVVVDFLFNRSKSDVYVVIGPSLDFRIFLPLFGWLFKRKVVVEINEYPFVGRAGSLNGKLKKWIYLNCVCRFYDGFIIISGALERLVLLHKNRRAQIIKIPVIGNFSHVARNHTSPLDVPYIIHAGSLLEEKDGIVGVIKAFAKACKQLPFGVNYVFTGNIESSPDAVKIRNAIVESGVEDKVKFTGYLNRDELNRYLDHASLAIVNKYDNLQNRYCFATKITEYVSFNIPVILTDVGEAPLFFNDGVDAYLVQPGDNDILSSKITDVLLNIPHSKSVANKALILITNEFSYQKHGERLAGFLKKI